MIKYLFKQRQTKPNKVSENIYKKYFNIIISKLKKGKNINTVIINSFIFNSIINSY